MQPTDHEGRIQALEQMVRDLEARISAAERSMARKIEGPKPGQPPASAPAKAPEAAKS